MYCRYCGNEMSPSQEICMNCGVPAGKGDNYCPSCRAQTCKDAIICINCGADLTPKPKVDNTPKGKSRLVAGLLALFLGYLGVHNFYLKHIGKAISQLLLTFAFPLSYIPYLIFMLGTIDRFTFFMMIFSLVIGILCVTASGIWAFVEAIFLLSGKKKNDGEGKPLSS